MTTTQSMDNKNISDNTVCPQCGNVLPAQARFCGSCGKEIPSENEEREVHPTIADDDEAQVDTVRIRALPAAKRQALLSIHSSASNGIAERTANDSPSPQDGEVAATEQLTTPPASPPVNRWGWFPAISLISTMGVLLIALAYEGGRLAAQSWPELLFWFGMLLLFIPVAARLLSARPTRQERIALLVVTTINFYLVKYLQYPLYFAYYDEFLHVRSTQDIAASSHLFQANPLLPISAYYPGLEIITNALSSLTGLSTFLAGTLVIGIAMLILVLSLYLIYERISNSMHIAGIATLLYMVNPSFIFFDTMFAYESLALPLAIFVVFVIVRRGSVPVRQRPALVLLTWLGIVAVVVTHHLTSFALLVFLCAWSIVFLLLWKAPVFRKNQAQRVQAGPRGAALVAFVLTVLWLMYTDWQAVTYLAPHITNTMNQAIQILTHRAPARQLFHSNTSSSASPLWERIAAYGSEVLILVGLPFGLREIWRRLRTNAFAFTLGCLVLIYPASLLLHLTPTGAELANRATEFLFVALAFVLAIGAVQALLARSASWKRTAIVTGAVTIIFFGQMILGSGQPWSLLPGPYLVGADARSIEPEGITAAEWADAYLGAGNVVASDRDNTLLMATFGNQEAETAGSGKIPVSSLFLSPYFGPNARTVIEQDGIQYLVVDLRLSTALPAVGTYFNSANTQPATTPLSRAALTKFDGVQDVSRIFDSGDIIIYNVEAISRGPAISTPNRSQPARPALPRPSQLETWVRSFYLWDILPP